MRQHRRTNKESKFSLSSEENGRHEDGGERESIAAAGKKENEEQ